jgi:hypothetical protein
MNAVNEPLDTASRDTLESPAAESARHVDYPHLPGSLYDCPACEAECHCTPGDAECVFEGEHNGMADA